MYCHNTNATFYAIQRGEISQPTKGPTRDEVITAIVNSIDVLPEKRERGREPILEPHYKLVAIVHKLFKRKEIDHKEGERILQNTPYSQNICGPENGDDWERYILNVLKALKTADKSSWHHRMIIRTALVIYDGDPRDPMVARGAKHELTQQMFTKTMSVQVWKPEYERPGRHFVYTTRYTRFFIQLLDQTNDKLNMELLAKRVRRKQLDFFEHSELWREICLQYLHTLRRIGGIPVGHEDAIFRSLNPDEFAIQANRLEAYCKSVTTPEPIVDAMRDATELKRINNGLFKSHLFDDLIGDTYALLYATVAPQIPPLPSEQLQQPQQPLVNTSSLVPLGSELQSMPSLAHQVDGAPDSKSISNMPFAIYPPSTSQQPNPSSRSRPKPIPHREILRRADAASLKPVAPTTVSTVMAIRSPPPSHSHLYSANGPSPEEPLGAGSSSTKADEQSQGLPSAAPTRRPSVAADVETRSFISLQTEEDDESELSELDESEVREIQEECNIQDPVHQEPSIVAPASNLAGIATTSSPADD
jgi:hypothetical protein